MLGRKGEIVGAVSRRKILQATAFTAGAFATAPLLAACASPSELDQEPLEKSLAFLEHEINQNPNLTSLYEYGEEKTSAFIGRAYNVWRHATGRNIAPSHLLADSVLGNTPSIKLAERLSGTRTDIDTYDFNNNVAGTDVTNTPDGRLTMMYNQDAYFLTRDTDHAKLAGNNVLKALLFIATHEPFHYAAQIKNISTETYQLRDPSGTSFEHTYTQSYGFVLRGTNNATKGKVSHLAALDEASIYILQRNMIATAIPFYPDSAAIIPQPEAKLTAINDFFTRLGYDDPTKILDLREADGPSLLLIKDIANKKIISTGQAYEYLITLNYFLSEPTVPVEAIIQHINALDTPGYPSISSSTNFQ